VHLGKTFQEEGELVAGGLFVVYDECIDRHDASGNGRGQYMRTRRLRSTWVRALGKASSTEATKSTEGIGRIEPGETISWYSWGATLEFKFRWLESCGAPQRIMIGARNYPPEGGRYN
jgi:hypothetical protein